MCGGSCSTSHGVREAERRSRFAACMDRCSCKAMGANLHSIANTGTLLYLVSHLPCVNGEAVELLKTQGIFRGATNILSSAKASNLLLINTDAPNRLLQAVAEPFHELTTGVRYGHLVGAAMVIAAVGIFGIMLPYLLASVAEKGRRTQRVIESLGTAFAAGGFWGLALIHVMLEAVEACEENGLGIHFHNGAFFNAAFPLAAAGYFVVLALDSTAAFHSHKRYSETGKHHVRAHGVSDVLIATVALTVHSFFEGIVVGLRDEVMLIWVACISVIGHKWAAGFALSTRMRQEYAPKALKWTSLIVFVAASPIGVLVGGPIGGMGDNSVVGALNAISAGVLLYVASETTAEVFRMEQSRVEHECGSLTDEETCGNYEIEIKDDAIVSTHEHAHEHAHSDCSGHLEPIQRVAGGESVVMASTKLRPAEKFCNTGDTRVSIFVAKILFLFLGIAMIFGMMTLHMSQAGEEHIHS